MKPRRSRWNQAVSRIYLEHEQQTVWCQKYVDTQIQQMNVLPVDTSNGAVHILLAIQYTLSKFSVFYINGRVFTFQGRLYYVRVSAYNMKGWGPPAPSCPPSAAPSSEFILTQFDLFYFIFYLSSKNTKHVLVAEGLSCLFSSL